MSSNKPAILVAYPDTDRELENAAREIAKGLEAATLRVTLLPASRVDPPVLLASRLYFFGVGDAMDPAWDELRRILKGINLAGRLACAYAKDGEAQRFLGFFADAEPETRVKMGLSDLFEWTRGIASV